MSDNASRDDVGRALLSFGKAPLQYRTFERPSHVQAQAPAQAEAHAQADVPPAPHTPAPYAVVPVSPQHAASSRFPLLGAALGEAASVDVSNIATWALSEDADSTIPEPAELPPEPLPPVRVSPRIDMEKTRSGSAPSAALPPPVVPLAPVWAPREPEPVAPRLSVVAARDERTENPRALSHVFRILGAGRPAAATETADPGSSLSRLLGSL